MKSSGFASSQLAEPAIHRRAIEAVIWGMPAVNVDLMLRVADVAERVA